MKQNFEVGKEYLNDNPETRQAFRIAIFGTAGQTEKDLPALEKAKALGGRFIEQGFSIGTGGYRGIMKAASEGAAEKAAALGLKPQDRITAYTMIEAERFKDFEVKQGQKIRSGNLPERLGHLINDSEGYVVLNGGQGTVVELFTTLESERIAKTFNEEKLLKPIVIIDESGKMTDALSTAAQKEKKLQSAVTAANVFILNNEPGAIALAGEIMEAYYQRNLGGKTDEEINEEFGKYNLGEFLNNQENFSQGGGI